jgi:RNA polymerase sigma factor (sigma-70 family)
MAQIAVNRVLRHIRQAALRQDVAGLTDGELLEAYLRRGDHAAFEGLVRRHGAMVLGVCRRVLRNDADAEDAFQATFLVLVKKAGSIRSPSAISNWLYGVAHTTALRAKAMNRKRQTREREAGSIPRHQACEEVWRAVQSLLDAEMASLPDKYRIPIVLCDLESSTIKEAARHLGWPQGTVATRLARGRALLAKRLAKHGLVVSAGTLITALSHGVAKGGVPPGLVIATVKAISLASGLSATGPAMGLVSARVIALSQGVLQTMFLTKLKSCLACFTALAILSAGVGSLCRGSAAEGAVLEPAAVQDTGQPGKQVQQNDPQALRQEIERLRLEVQRMKAELRQAQAQIDVFKAQAEQARAQAEVERLRAVNAEVQSRRAAAGAAAGGDNLPEHLRGRDLAIEAYRRAVDLETLRNLEAVRTTPADAEHARKLAADALKALQTANPNSPAGEQARKLAAEALKALGAANVDANSAADADRARKLAAEALKVLGAAGGDPNVPDAERARRDYARALQLHFDKQAERASPNARPADEANQAKTNKPEPPVTASASAPDGSSVAVAQGTVILLVDVKTGKLLFRSAGHTAPVTALAFTPDGKSVVSGGKDKGVRVWDVPSGKELRRFETALPVVSIRISPDGRTLTIIDSTQAQHYIDLPTGKILRVRE